MLRIGMFSKLGKTTIKTLRHYDEVGLLKPAFVDEATGYRYYATGQLQALYEIVSLRQMGFSIGEIVAMESGRDMDTILQQRLRQLNEQQDTLADQIFRLENYMRQRKGDKAMEYQAVIKDIPEVEVFSYRRKVPTYGDLFGMIGEMQEKLARTNPDVKFVEPDYCFNVYLDGEYKDHDVDVEFCQAVVAPGQDAEGLVFKKMPAVRVATVLHKGPYEQLGAAYAYIMKWIEENGYEVAGHPRESYIEGMWSGKEPGDWLTEIQFPVIK